MWVQTPRNGLSVIMTFSTRPPSRSNSTTSGLDKVSDRVPQTRSPVTPSSIAGDRAGLLVTPAESGRPLLLLFEPMHMLIFQGQAD
jgi:hypothetical protein